MIKHAGIPIIILSLLLGITPTFAAPDLQPATLQTPGTTRTLSLPAGAVHGNVISLGTSLDPQSGKLVEGYAILHPKKAYAKPPWAGGGKNNGGTTSSTCFAFLSKGARWKTTEEYILDTTNTDGLSDSFVNSAFQAALDAWDDEVAFDVFGTRNTELNVDGAEETSPDGKNEIFFGNIEGTGTIAVTIVWGIFRGSPSGRELVEFDMVFDDNDFLWGDAGPTNETALGDTSVMDFLNVATHEVGHAAGMGHPDDSCTEETMHRFSQNGETKRRTLEAGDIAGIKELY